MSEANKKIDTQWILIRGLARESRHWGNFPQELESVMSPQGEITRVDAIDLPGAGRYSEMRSPISISEITEFMRTKFLEIRERQRREGFKPASTTYLVAISLGGMVAARWLERWPDDFKGCVLINTSFKGFSPLFKRLSPPSYKHFFHILRAKEAVERELNILKMISNRPDIHHQTAQEWAGLYLERPVSLENLTRQLLAASRFSSTLRQPPIPVLVLSSAQDRMVDPSCSKTIADRWHAKFAQHPTAGHDLPLDDGSWVVEQIRAFAKSL